MNIEKIILNGFSFYLEDFGDCKGKITITGNCENYSHYWGSMGTDLKSFLKKIDNGYFVGKLMSNDKQQVFSSKYTGRNIRKIWKEEIMPWYKHLEFQKDFREKLKYFLIDIQDSNHFVYEFNWFIRGLDYFLINDYKERNEIEGLVRSVLGSECWYLIDTELSIEYKRLSDAFTELKKYLKSGKIEEVVML